ncbi:MAG TPA: glycosyltransferase family 4 protein [Nostocaceae cyanobacterium]|nr:glycosyltransferase family 4 protein [Nostocaceae cyanobacterium]
MENNKDTRIAVLIPSLIGGNYWHPVFCELSKVFKQTIIYTGAWPGFSPGFTDTFQIQVVGKTSFVETGKSPQEGYGRGFIKVSPQIISYLYKFKPQIIFASGFSLWTIIAFLFKPLLKWQLIIIYDGSSPNVDYQDLTIRTWLRKTIAQSADALITNSQTGTQYLTQILQADKNKVFTRPYQVPDANALLNRINNHQVEDKNKTKRPIFLFIGQLIKRKGLEYLLQACMNLQSWGCDYTVMVLGEGPLRGELETYTQEHNLNVQWIGWVDYGSVGAYFQNADVFVLPSLEDTWGMVVLEAMVFERPILCSQWVGAKEMIVDGVNGFIFNPKEPEELAKLMRRFIDNPDLIAQMGKESKNLISQHTPTAAAKFMMEVISQTLKQK